MQISKISQALMLPNIVCRAFLEKARPLETESLYQKNTKTIEDIDQKIIVFGNGERVLKTS